ncbi:late competence development ComFB family protein [Pontibacillus yanchengensis]|uniref:late competence development ComFB family protein n=1 Tax=Pontibacillus yanchengensis TaxID=462910 RepID=UPI001F43B0C6|nr:late competence development ComFB family protein [Pontibacillus yanchengensis]
MSKEIVNVMEELASSIVTVMLMSPDYQTFCKCEKCRRDILALSLNTLPTHYVTTEGGRQQAYEQLNTNDNRKWINKRIISAIHVVGRYPKHNE